MFTFKLRLNLKITCYKHSVLLLKEKGLESLMEQGQLKNLTDQRVSIHMSGNPFSSKILKGKTSNIWTVYCYLLEGFNDEFLGSFL